MEPATITITTTPISEEAKACPHFLTCTAPLCPANLNPESDDVWFIGEPICSNRAYFSTPMVKRQRKLIIDRPERMQTATLTPEYLIVTAPKRRPYSPEELERFAKVWMGQSEKYPPRLPEWVLSRH